VRRKQTPLEVLTDENGNPSRLKTQGREKAVRRTLDFWRYNGRWWQREAPRDYFLLELSDGRVIEIYRAAGQWLLSRVAD
jgi:hypothetical protein